MLVPHQLAQCTRLWLLRDNLEAALEYAERGLGMAARWGVLARPRGDPQIAVVTALEAGARCRSERDAEAFWSRLYARIEADSAGDSPLIRNKLDRYRTVAAAAVDGSHATASPPR